MTLDIRAYQPGDEQAILGLFAEAHPGREMTLAEWNWRYRTNPAGPGCIMLAWEASRLVAHYGTMSRLVLWEGAPVRTELSVNTMTAPSHRGQRLFQRLAEASYAVLESDGVAAVWGFPNSMSHRIFLRDLGWRNIGVIPFLRRSTEGVAADGAALDGFVEIERNDQRIEALWRRCSKGMDAAGVSDAAYIEWRFAGDRGDAYRLLALPGSDGALEAVGVWKRYQAEMQVMLFLAASAVAAKGLVEAIVAMARREDTRSVALWCSLYDASHLELERMGFTLDGPVTYLGWRGFRPRVECDVRLDRLTAQMHDSDIF